MNRRQFLSITGCSVAAARIGLSADDQAPAIGFGFSLYGMKSLAIVDALKLCREIGYDCIELPVLADWPADSLRLSDNDRRRIRDTLKECHLRLSALMENLPLVVGEPRHAANLERLKAAGELGHALSSQRPPVLETVLGGEPAKWDEMKQAMVDRLGQWADVAAKTETVIAIKPHVGGALHTPTDAVWLVTQVNSPWIRCVYDYSHYLLRGIELGASLQQLAPHTVFVHVKDARGDAGKYQFLLPGAGDTDYVRHLQLLAAAAYRGDVVVEVSGQIHSQPGYDPAATAKQCYANLAPVFARAGVRRG